MVLKGVTSRSFMPNPNIQHTYPVQCPDHARAFFFGLPELEQAPIVHELEGDNGAEETRVQYVFVLVASVVSCSLFVTSPSLEWMLMEAVLF